MILATFILATLAPDAGAARDGAPTVGTVYLHTYGKDTTCIYLWWQVSGAWDWEAGTELPILSYELRLSTAGEILEENWAEALSVASYEAEGGFPSGMFLEVRVGGLTPGMTYWFAMKAYVDGASSIVADPCYSEETSTDFIAPSQIDSLAVASVDEHEVGLAWQAPGDDAMDGAPTAYDIRFSTTGPIVTAADFDAATRFDAEIVPVIAGSSQSVSVGGLDSETTYWFSVRAADEVGNWSTVSSSSPRATTLRDDPPDRRPCLGAAGTSPIRIAWIFALGLVAVPIRRRSV